MLAFTGIFTFLVSVTNHTNQESQGKDISKRKCPGHLSIWRLADLARSEWIG